MNKGKILVVDDDATQRRMFQRTFVEAGFAVDATASAEETRALLAKNRYDLILLDLVLDTERCGIDLLVWLKQAEDLKNIPVITVSGHDSGHQLLLEAYDAGARDAVSKPIAMELMIRKMEEFIAEARATARRSSNAKTGAGGLDVRVLVVEDDPEVQENYKAFFQYYGRGASWTMVETADDALHELQTHVHEPFDVALIDWTLTRGTMNGYRLMQKIRSDPATRSILAFMVTGNENELDIQLAFEAGADDYVTKPLRDGQLAARLGSRLKRRDEELQEHKVFELDGLALDPVAARVCLGGQVLDLYPTEFSLLKLFLAHPDRPLSSRHLWRSVRGYESTTCPKALTIQISNLRKKLGAWSARIETCRGEGYMLNSRYSISR